MSTGLDLSVSLSSEKSSDGVSVARECMSECEPILESCEYILATSMSMSLLLLPEDWTEGWAGTLYLEE